MELSTQLGIVKFSDYTLFTNLKKTLLIKFTAL